MSLAQTYLADALRTFRSYKRLGDGALAQISDEGLHSTLDPGSNSIAVIVKHIGGNLRSRFRDFLTSDGEKPDRDRDSEFEIDGPVTRAQVLAWWESGWATVFATIESLAPADLERTVTIRGEAFQVVEALNRSAAHIAYHVGQVVFLAKHLAGPSWRSLSIPKGESAKHLQGNYKQR